MSEELKVFKNDTDQAIYLNEKTMEEIGLDIDDTLIVTKTDDGFILTKKTSIPFEEEWDEFIQSSDSYDDKELYDWGETRGREKW